MKLAWNTTTRIWSTGVKPGYLLLLLLIVTISFVLHVNWLFIPFIGRHGWNEALYASIVEDYIINKRSYPYVVQYIRPDFNLGFLFYALGGLSVYYLGDHEWAYRLPIFLASLVNILLLYLIGKSIFEGRKRHILSLILAFMYALVPLAVYYGTRFQPDELMLLFYLASMLALIKYSQSKRRGYLALSSLLLGVSSFLVKQVFMPFLLTIIIVSIIINLKEKSVNYLGKAILIICNIFVTIIFFLIPLIIQLLLLYLLAPSELSPMKFYLSRVIVGPLSRLLPQYSNILNRIYIQGMDLSKVFQGIELAFGWPFGLPYLLLTILGLIILKNYGHLTSINKVNILSNFLIGIVVLYIMRYHIINHEYYLHVILLPSLILLTIAIDSISAKITKCVKDSNQKYYALLLILAIILQSFSFSYIEYQNFKDGFANPSAVKAGTYINKITSPGDVIIVQSPVMGFYAKRPNLHWGYLWTLNKYRLKHISLVDMIFKGKSLLEWDSIYSTTNASNIIRIIEQWQPKVVVISPDVSDVFFRHRDTLLPLLEYITLLYEKYNTVDFYTIKIRRHTHRYQIDNIVIYIINENQMLLMRKYIPLIEINVFLDSNCRLNFFKYITFSRILNNSILLSSKYGYMNISFDISSNILSINLKSSTNFIKIIIKSLSLYHKYVSIHNTSKGVIMNLNLPYYETRLIVKTKNNNNTIMIIHNDSLIVKGKDGVAELEVAFITSPSLNRDSG